MSGIAEFIQWAVAVVAAVLGLWLAARIVTAAYFKSKQEHEATKRKPQ